MRAMRTITLRSFSKLWPSAPAVAAMVAFLALSGLRFAWMLMNGDGAGIPPAALWAVAAVPFLPIFAALSTMRMIAGERASGRLDLLLTAPVPEREIVLGNFFAALAWLTLALAVYAAMPLWILPHFSPALGATLRWWAFIPAFAGLFMQGALWCACGLLASASCRSAATSALAATLFTAALPYAAFHAATAWFPAVRECLPEIPAEAHAADFATGLVSLTMPVFCIVFSGFAVFAATKTLAMTRFCGRGAKLQRLSTATVIILCFVFASLAAAFAARLRFTVELPFTGAAREISARTRQILSEAPGVVKVTCFMNPRSAQFRPAGRLLRGLAAASRAVAGAELKIQYADPRWDRHKAAQLAAAGIKEGSLVFERGRRRVSVDTAALFPPQRGALDCRGALVAAGEEVCAAAIRRLSHPPARETIYWTSGHGELSPDSYDTATGMSDIARELRGDGFRVQRLDFSMVREVPADCAALIVAGARGEFSRNESAKLRSYMEKGGRMLVLAVSDPEAGAAKLLREWGIRQLPFTAVSPRTLNGSDVAADDFAPHKVTAPLAGCTLVFQGAGVFETPAENAEAAALVRTGPEAWGESRPAARPLAHDPAHEPRGPLVLAVALERGGGAAKDLAIRPARIVAVAESTFAANGALAARGNANRDFFMNAVAWLAGLDAPAAPRRAGGAQPTGMERTDWMAYAAACLALAAFAGAAALLAARLRRGGAQK